MSESILRSQTAQQQTAVPYSVVPADFDIHKADILRVCAKGDLQLSSSKYDWKYGQNPIGPAKCWVVVSNVDNKIIGTTALFPRRLLVNGVSYPAAVAGDFAVDGEHRSFWPAFLLQKAATSSCKAGTFSVLYGFPNDVSKPIVLRAGYRGLDFFRAGVKLLRSKPSLEAKRFTAPLSRASGLIDFVLKVASRERRPGNPGYAIEAPKCFDERFDHFWRKELPKYAVIAERNSEFMNWRFACAPHKKYAILAAIHNDTGEIAGYIVSWVQQGKVRISDVLVSDMRVLDLLLPEFIREQRRGNAHAITMICLGSPDLIRKFKQFGFFFRRASGRALVYALPSFAQRQILLDSSKWHLLDGDSDS